MTSVLRGSFAAVISLAGLFTWAETASAQGDLSPPAAPAPSMRTLLQVEPRTPIGQSPFVIKTPGAYVVTTNLIGRQNQHGISIEAHNVTLDLGGFVLAPGEMGTLDGVHCNGYTGITIYNGRVSEWGRNGINATNSSDVSVVGVHAVSNRLDGIYVPQGAIRDCMARANGRYGIWTRSHCLVEASQAVSNQNHGIVTSSECNVLRCQANANGGDGISVSAGSVVSDCQVAKNAIDGIGTAIGCNVTGCSARDNGDDGIDANSGCQVSQCTAAQNGGRGIDVSIGTHVESCASYGNNGDGISVGSKCYVLNNTVADNGSGTNDAAGIVSNFQGSRFDGNLCRSNDRGLEVTSSGNIIVRNTCSGNTTNYAIAAGNSIAEITTSPGSNFTAGAWNNFSY